MLSFDERKKGGIEAEGNFVVSIQITSVVDRFAINGHGCLVKKKMKKIKRKASLNAINLQELPGELVRRMKITRVERYSRLVAELGISSRLINDEENYLETRIRFNPR